MITDTEKWAKARAYNNVVKDATRVKCYICGGPGHFMEICPMHESLEERFGTHGLRRALYGRAITLMIEKKMGHGK